MVHLCQDIEKAENDYIERVHVLCLPFEIEEADEYLELESFCQRFNFGVYIENGTPIYSPYQSYDITGNGHQFENQQEYKYTLKYQVEKHVNNKTQDSMKELSILSIPFDDTEEFKYSTKCVLMKVQNDHLKEVKLLLHSWQNRNNLLDNQYLFTMKELESMINQTFSQCISLTNNNPLTRLFDDKMDISFGIIQNDPTFDIAINKLRSHIIKVNHITESSATKKQDIENPDNVNLEWIDHVISKTNSKSFLNTLQSVFDGDQDLFGILLLIYEIRSKYMNHIFDMKEQQTLRFTESHQTVLLQIFGLLYGFIIEVFRTFRMCYIIL